MDNDWRHCPSPSSTSSLLTFFFPPPFSISSYVPLFHSSVLLPHGPRLVFFSLFPLPITAPSIKHFAFLPFILLHLFVSLPCFHLSHPYYYFCPLLIRWPDFETWSGQSARSPHSCSSFLAEWSINKLMETWGTQTDVTRMSHWPCVPG